MNTENSLFLTFSELLHKTLRGSRYAKRMLESDAVLMSWLQDNYITPCNRQEMVTLLAQSGFDLNDEVQLARAEMNSGSK